MKKSLIIIFLLFIKLPLYGQLYQEGYIVSLQGDTTNGFVNTLGNNLFKQEVKFRFTKYGKDLVYTPENVTAYGAYDGRKFIAKSNRDNEKKYLELIFEGPLLIYYELDIAGEFFYVQTDSKPLRLLPYKEELITKNRRTIKVSSKLHQTILRIYTGYQDSLEPLITSIDEPSQKNLLKLAKAYKKIEQQKDTK